MGLHLTSSLLKRRWSRGHSIILPCYSSKTGYELNFIIINIILTSFLIPQTIVWIGQKFCKQIAVEATDVSAKKLFWKIRSLTAVFRDGPVSETQVEAFAEVKALLYNFKECFVSLMWVTFNVRVNVAWQCLT